MIGVGEATSTLGGRVHIDLDTLATALYVRIEDELKANPLLRRSGPAATGR
jgi:hypothetical protein